MKSRMIAITLAAALTFTPALSAQAGKLKVLHNFGSSKDGNAPSGPLLLDSHGNLYGVTRGGPGQYGNGVVYVLTPQSGGGWHENILHSFAAGSDGGFPWGGVLFDKAGNIYGTVEGNLSTAVGGVFDLSPSSGGWSNAILYDIYSGPGLVFDKIGNLYGSMGGGSASLGALGELSPRSGGWSYAELYSFCPQYGCADGWSEPAPPIWDGKGNLWGVTTYGGIGQSPCSYNQGCGVMFEMTPNGDGTWTYNLIHQFAASSTDGQFPLGGLVIDANGTFYGSTAQGGAHGLGTIFKFVYTGGQWVETILYDFSNCTNGCYAQGTLTRDKAGNLYGTASGGTGSCAGFTCGVVFKLAHQTNGAWKYSVLADLTPTAGGLPPYYGVILDGSGNLYGVTSSFGKYNFGTAFEITP